MTEWFPTANSNEEIKTSANRIISDNLLLIY